MTTLTARGIHTGLVMLQLIAEHAGMTERDFSTGAWLDKIDPALDITARDIITGVYVDKLNAAEPNPTGLLLVPNGATESADGEYQRFEPIDPIAGTWIAQLAMEDWQDALVVQFKAPALTTRHQMLMISFISGDITDLGYKLSCQITNGSISFGVFGGISTTYSAAQPASDTVITLTITQQSATLAYGEVSETIDISTDNLAVPFNCAVSSSGFEGDAVQPLSIKVGEPA